MRSGGRCGILIGMKRLHKKLDFPFRRALAVLLAVLVAAVAVLGWSEGRGALAALGAVGVYYCVLWLFRHKIEHTIHFSITKHY